MAGMGPYVYEDAPLATPDSFTGIPPEFGYSEAGNTNRQKRSRAKRTLACFKVFKAILARLIFFTHGFIAIWKVTVIYDNNMFYYLCGTLGCLILETILSVCIRQGEELKWFSPSVFFYLATVCPSVWFLELDRVEKTLLLNDTRANSADSASICMEMNQLPEAEWLKIFEQALMVILIIGRWLLPKGKLTRDQLSQLLLVYIGMAADIIEIFEAFRERAVIQTEGLVYTTLALWTWSLMQFTLVLTATKARKPRITASAQAQIWTDKSDYDDDSRGPCPCCWWCSADIWGILTTLILQDGPFLCLRLTFLFGYKVVSYSNVFFTIKNSLVIVLQVYRMVVLLHYSRKLRVQEYKLRNGDLSTLQLQMRTSKSVPERMAGMHHSFDTISA